jgi:hypothetical protein
MPRLGPHANEPRSGGCAPQSPLRRQTVPVHRAVPTQRRPWWILLLGLVTLAAAGCTDEGQNTVFEGSGGTQPADSDVTDDLARQAGDPTEVARVTGEPEPAPPIEPILHVLGSIRSLEPAPSAWQLRVPIIDDDLATIASLGCDTTTPDCSTSSLVDWATDRVEVLNVATSDAAGEDPDVLRSLVTAAEQAGVAVIGYGASEAEAIKATVFETHSVLVAVHAISMSTNGELAATSNGSGIAGASSFDALLESVAANLEQDLAVIVLIDWADRDGRAPSTEMVADVQQLVDLGVDAVIGHGSDFLQRFDQVAGTAVAYSLGNTTTTDQDPLRSDGALLRLEFGTPGRACLLAITASASGPALDDPDTITCGR